MIGRGKVGGLVGKRRAGKEASREGRGLVAAIKGKANPRQGLAAALKARRGQLDQRAPEPVVSQTQPAPAPTQTLQPAQPQPMVSAQPVGASQEIGQPAAQALPAQKMAQAAPQAASAPKKGGLGLGVSRNQQGGRFSGLPLRSKFLRRGRT